MNVNRVGNFYDVASGDRTSLAIATRPVVGVDESEMSAEAIISTPAWDRENDSLNPLGGDFENYLTNPVVFWDHGIDLTVPIATSMDSEGKLHVFPTESGIRSKSFFSQRNRDSEQIFALLADNIIRATSIRFKPKAQPQKSIRGSRYNEWEMEEWSWTGLGVNPEAVREVIQKGRLAGSNIGGSLMKSLKSSIPQRDKRNTDAWQPRPKRKSNMRKRSSRQRQSQTPTLPLGAQCILATHSHLKGVMHGVDAAQVGLENPRVKEMLENAKAMMSEITNVLQGGFAEEYPDADAKMAMKPKMDPEYKMDQECECEGEGDDCECDKSKMMYGDEYKMMDGDHYKMDGHRKPVEEMDDEERESMAKSFLAASTMDRFRLGGVSQQLKQLTTASNLTSQQKSVVRDVGETIGDIMEDAIKMRTEGDPKVAELQSQVKSLSAALEQSNKIIEEAIPAKR